jgi:hypothetical protein
MRRTDFLTTEVTEDTEEDKYEHDRFQLESYGLSERAINDVTG